jgi:hypothetical protein
LVEILYQVQRPPRQAAIRDAGTHVFVEGAERKTDVRGGLGSTKRAADGFRVGEGRGGADVALQCACCPRRVDVAEVEDVRMRCGAARIGSPTFKPLRDDSERADGALEPEHGREPRVPLEPARVVRACMPRLPVATATGAHASPP